MSISWVCPVVMSRRGCGSESRLLDTSSEMRKYLITVFAASSCSGVKVFDGCGPEGGGVGGGEGDVVVWEGCCGAVLQDSLPPHEDSSKAAVVVAVVMVLPM